MRLLFSFSFALLLVLSSRTAAAQCSFPEPHSSCKPVEVEVASLDRNGSDLFYKHIEFERRTVTAPEIIEIIRPTRQQLPLLAIQLTYGDQETNVVCGYRDEENLGIARLVSCTEMDGSQPKPHEATFVELAVSGAQDAKNTLFRARLEVATPCPGLPALTSKFIQYPDSVPGAYAVILDPAHVECTSVSQVAQQLATAAGGRVRHVYEHTHLGFSMRDATTAGAQAISKDPR
ncbi:MAG: hypothetical protein IRZ16_24210, partial [Myxococcaceae bacterium]|nr:hypothetical protein [Myxococcaceae bacterium]